MHHTNRHHHKWLCNRKNCTHSERHMAHNCRHLPTHCMLGQADGAQIYTCTSQDTARLPLVFMHAYHHTSDGMGCIKQLLIQLPFYKSFMWRTSVIFPYLQSAPHICTFTHSQPYAPNRTALLTLSKTRQTSLQIDTLIPTPTVTLVHAHTCVCVQIHILIPS